MEYVYTIDDLKMTFLLSEIDKELEKFARDLHSITNLVEIRIRLM